MSADSTTWPDRSQYRITASIPQPEAVREQRIVVRVVAVERCLRYRAGPGERQLADEVVIHAAIGLAEQHVGDAAALRSRQPGHDEGVACGELRLDHQRPAGKEHAGAWHGCLAQLLQQS